MSQVLESLRDTFLDRNTIDNTLYTELDVKRGLRNADGSGVLAGLSKVSSVLGVEVVDGQRVPADGKLRYRGIRIVELQDQMVSPHLLFEQTIFLLLLGQLPDTAQLTAFQTLLNQDRHIPESILAHVIKALPSANVMNKMQTVVSALYSLDPTAEGTDPYQNLLKSIALIAKLPLAAAYAYLSYYGQGEPQYLSPDPGMGMAASFLHVLRQGGEVSELEVAVCDLCLMLHAEHGGGNNSTFTTTVVTSSGTDVYSAIAAAISSLKGPLHGAANKKVMDMMADVKANVSDWTDRGQLRDYLAKIVRKEAHDKSGKIYGLGHAVYTKSDPRAVVLKKKAQELAETKGRLDEYNLYLAVEEEGPSVFNEVKGSDKVIAPNVDFFSGFVYDCLGIPQEVYTPMFAMARAAGWSAHRIEEILSGKRVIRPAYKFVG